MSTCSRPAGAARHRHDELADQDVVVRLRGSRPGRPCTRTLGLVVVQRADGLRTADRHGRVALDDRQHRDALVARVAIDGDRGAERERTDVVITISSSAAWRALRPAWTAAPSATVVSGSTGRAASAGTGARRGCGSSGRGSHRRRARSRPVGEPLPESPMARSSGVRRRRSSGPAASASKRRGQRAGERRCSPTTDS